jgi:hypothetical protein
MRSVRIARFRATAATETAGKAEPVVLCEPLWRADVHEADADQVPRSRKSGRSTGDVQGVEIVDEVVLQAL